MFLLSLSLTIILLSLAWLTCLRDSSATHTRHTRTAVRKWQPGTNLSLIRKTDVVLSQREQLVRVLWTSCRGRTVWSSELGGEMQESRKLEIHMIVIQGVWRSYRVCLIKTKGWKTASQMASLKCNQTQTHSSAHMKWNGESLAYQARPPNTLFSKVHFVLYVFLIQHSAIQRGRPIE